MNYQQYIPLIVEELKKAEPEKIILFGSYAYGVPNSDSDLDILVVSNDREMPETFEEKHKIYIKIAQLIDHFSSKIPIDLIVHTQSMHKLFTKKNSLFAQEINSMGKVLYSKEMSNK
ncbi:MAG: nucleotidyltransferase domain-containing protein [Bacteroidales bacterium]|nr:nucleotidyltransferase domain-containing protein [Bacteroidales bacterium]